MLVYEATTQWFKCLTQERQLLNSYEVVREDKDGILLAGCGSQIKESLPSNTFCVCVLCDRVHNFSTLHPQRTEQIPEYIKSGYMLYQTQ